MDEKNKMKDFFRNFNWTLATWPGLAVDTEFLPRKKGLRFALSSTVTPPLSHPKCLFPSITGSLQEPPEMKEEGVMCEEFPQK